MTVILRQGIQRRDRHNGNIQQIGKSPHRSDADPQTGKGTGSHRHAEEIDIFHFEMGFFQ